MKKLSALLSVALLSFALGFTGCSDSEKKDDTPVKSAPTMSDAEAIAGTYAKGNIRWKANSEGKFSFDMPSACPTAPCPVSRKGGSWELKRGKIHLTFASGTQVWGYTVAHSPRSLTLSGPSGKSYTLSHAP